MILTELNRIASHLLWLGTHALDIGAITPLFYTFRDREEILKIFEKYCGARLTTHAFRIGGCSYETYDGFEQEVKKFLDFVTPKDRRIRRTAHHQPHLGRAHQGRRQDFRQRVHRTRRDRAGAARQRREVGPAQGAALRRLRRISISIFPPARTATPTTGTSSAWQEMRQSLRIIDQAVGKIPEGPIMAKVAKGDQAAGRARSIIPSKRPRASWDISS